MKHSPKRFARVPVSVLFDGRLTIGAKAAYAVMVLGIASNGNSAQIGMRLLGRLTGNKSPATASRWLAELEQCGHIVRHKGAKGFRNTYEFTSPVFKGVSTPVDATVGQPQENSGKSAPPKRQEPQIQHCALCRRGCKQIGKSGWCRTCVNDANRLRQWEAARVELGPGASEEQIAQHLHLRKLTAGWRKVIRRAKAA